MSYIGNSPGVASQRVETAFTATASQTVFTPSSGYTLGYCDVYYNGVKLVNGDDYTAADGVSITLATAAAAGDSVVVVASFPRGLSDGYLKAEADAKYVALTGDQTVAGVKTFSGSATIVNGNLGVGTSSVLGNSTFNAALGIAVRNQSTSMGYFQTYNANAGSNLKTWRFGGDGSGNLVFETVNDAYSAATGRMTLDADGKLGVGSTSPSQRLVVQDTSTVHTAVNITNGSGNYNIGVTGPSNTWGAGAGALVVRDSSVGATRMVIDPNGVLLVNAASRANASDHTAIKLAVFGEAHLQQQGCHLWFGDSTNASPLGIGEGLVNTVGTDQDFLSVYYRSSCRFFTGTSEVARLDNSNRFLQLAGRKSSAYGAASNQQMWVGTVSSIANGSTFSLFYINGIYDNLCYEFDVFINAGGYFSVKRGGIMGYNGFASAYSAASSSGFNISQTGSLYNETLTVTNNHGATVNQYIICVRVWGYNTTANISTGGADLIVSSYLTRIE